MWPGNDLAGPPDQAGAGEHALAVAHKLAEWRDRWSGLASWFVTADRRHPSQAELLRNRTRQAIPDLLATVGMLQDRRMGHSDRSADFRVLGAWFAETADDADAHRLWRAAFGLTSARHLTADQSAESPDVPASMSWLDAPQTEIAPRLRATGRYARRATSGASPIDPQSVRTSPGSRMPSGSRPRPPGTGSPPARRCGFRLGR